MSLEPRDPPVVSLHLRRRHLVLVGLACAGLLAAVPVALYAVGPLTQFTNGTVADATAINTNFGQLKTAVDTLEGRPGILQVVQTLTPHSSANLTPTGWVDLASITLTPAKAGNLVKFDWAHNVGVGRGTSNTRIDYRLQRVAPTTSTVFKMPYAGANGLAYDYLIVNIGGTALDTAVSNAPHTYTLQVRKANFEAASAGVIYPWWHSQGEPGEAHRIIAMELNQ